MPCSIEKRFALRRKQGVITWFDNFSILLKRDQHVQLVYKHAISTIMPMAPVQLQELDDEAEGAGDD